MSAVRRSRRLLLAALGTVWISDSAAYFIGRRFGRRKLAPSISPGKTWEGVAGALAAVGLYALAWAGLGAPETPWVGGARTAPAAFLVVLVGLSLAAELLVNSRAIVVWYKGSLSLPTYGRVRFGDEFGLGYHYEANYRELARQLAQGHDGWVLLPPVPYDPYEQGFRTGSYPPYPPSVSDRHYLGTDRIGRDILARLFYGFRIAIFFSLAFVLLTFIAGTLLGILMGYLGGRFDLVVQRLIEIWEQVPFLYVVMIVVSVFQPQFILFLGIFVLFGWTSRTWAVRAMTYRERERDYVQAARTMGASRWRISDGG